MSLSRVLLVSGPSLAFAVLVVLAHAVEPELFAHPLSFARDGRAAVVGWAAFVALTLAIAGYSVVYLRSPLRRFAVGPLVAVGLMVVVTMTPTFETIHDLAAGAVLVWVSVFFVVRWLDVGVWRVVGVLAGVIVAAGLLLCVNPACAQKLLIACQVIVMNMDAVRVGRLTTPPPGTSGP